MLWAPGIGWEAPCAAQEGTRALRSPPVELTASTTGAPAGWYCTALIEQGDTTMRWNRSRWVPIAAATAALIGSAWDTATTVLPGWAATSRQTAEQMRTCI